MFCIFQANYGGGSSEPCQVSELGSQSAATGQVSGTNNREYIFTVLGYICLFYIVFFSLKLKLFIYCQE